MATKAQNQITIVDLTDAYSVMLSMDAVSLNGAVSTLGSQQQVTIYVSAYRGDTAMTPSVGTITCPSNVTASKGSASNNRIPITITFASALEASGRVSFPVTVEDITITKEFSFAIAFKGATGEQGPQGVQGETGAQGPQGETGAQGPQGNAGADALTMVIISSNGSIFKNTAIATTLTAHVYKGGAEVTGSALTALGTIKWYKDGGSTAVGTGATLTISAGDVSNKAIYEAKLES